MGIGPAVTDDSIDRLPDQRDILSLGQNLLHGQGLKFFDPRFADDVWAYRTPAYPMLIAVCRGSVRVVRVVQALWTLRRSWQSTCWRGGGWRAGRRCSPRPSVALNPFLIYFTGLILTETLFTAMLAWGMVLVVGSGGEGKRRQES